MTAVVVPAHNEARTIESVLTAIALAPSVSHVITIADACTDETATLAAPFGEVLETHVADKGSAMAVGLAHVADPLTLFIDGDLSGLLPAHVEALATLPPLEGQLAGLTETGLWVGALPPITGERRLPTDFLRTLGLSGSGYRVELRIDAALARAGLPWRHVALRGVTNPSRASRDPGGWGAMWGVLAATSLEYAPELLAYTVRPRGRKGARA